LAELAIVEPDRTTGFVVRDLVFADQVPNDALFVLTGQRQMRRDFG
jgi:hypothetical protein